VVWISMVLAVLAAYAAAARPARAIARVPVATALSGRPPAPKPARRLAVPFGLGLLAIAFGIRPAQVNPGADVLTRRPGLSSTQHMQLWDAPKVPTDTPCTPGGCLANPADPGDRRAPVRDLGAEHGDHRSWHAPVQPHGDHGRLADPGVRRADRHPDHKRQTDRGHGRGEHRDRRQHSVLHAGHRRELAPRRARTARHRPSATRIVRSGPGGVSVS